VPFELFSGSVPSSPLLFSTPVAATTTSAAAASPLSQRLPSPPRAPRLQPACANSLHSPSRGRVVQQEEEVGRNVAGITWAGKAVAEDHASGIVYYDSFTVMPKGTGASASRCLCPMCCYSYTRHRIIMRCCFSVLRVGDSFLSSSAKPKGCIHRGGSGGGEGGDGDEEDEEEMEATLPVDASPDDRPSVCADALFSKPLRRSPDVARVSCVGRWARQITLHVGGPSGQALGLM